jgi:hypothetical protein
MNQAPNRAVTRHRIAPGAREPDTSGKTWPQSTVTTANHGSGLYTRSMWMAYEAEITTTACARTALNTAGGSEIGT